MANLFNLDFDFPLLLDLLKRGTMYALCIGLLGQRLALSATSGGIRDRPILLLEALSFRLLDDIE
ncbi:hypothetical protein VP1G_10819 [Cytospora mali]|uniref:Uncharacterized protein n=1 Tax=Cytospora mali TaxID=578113 RepID=A0A194UY33_CYTMA|nr:hypothetical protein VP1G_10819 [Valsa mali var. pyri (nom. inval.)]